MAEKIKDIMTTNVVTCKTDDTIFDLATKMVEHDIGFLPIKEGENLVGVVTDRDLVIRGYANKLDSSAAAAEVMTDGCISISPDATVDEASELMAMHQIRRLCVVEKGKLVGVCAIGDLAVRYKYMEDAGHALSEISEKDQSTTYLN